MSLDLINCLVADVYGIKSFVFSDSGNKRLFAVHPPRHGYEVYEFLAKSHSILKERVVIKCCNRDYVILKSLTLDSIIELR